MNKAASLGGFVVCKIDEASKRRVVEFEDVNYRPEVRCVWHLSARARNGAHSSSVNRWRSANIASSRLETPVLSKMLVR
jgi:hypothetical protein